MRVALLTYSTKPRGGVVHTLNLAEALARLGIDVSVWTLARGGDEGFFRRVDPAVRTHLIPFADVADESVTDRILRSIHTIGDAFDHHAYDIVHAQDCISANAVGRCIRTIHHLDTFTTPVLVDCHEKAVVRPYARICVSAAVADEVGNRWGYQPTVIPNGVDYQRFSDASADNPESVAARQKWTSTLGRYILAVGGIEPRKGSIDLLKAYARLRADHPEVSLVFAGGETLFDYRAYRAEFDRLHTDLGVSPIVLGTVADDELPALVAGCAAFAFPSVKEGFGLAAMEALAAGKPVIVRELPILREVFADTVAYATDDVSLARALSQTLSSDSHDAGPGQRLARSLTWESAARAHVDFYRSHPPL